MEGTIKYVNPEQKYGYIKAEGEHDISFKMKEGREYPLNAHVTFDLIVLENSRRYADNIVLQEHGPRKHGKLKISNPYAPSKIENQIAENKESCAIISELISKSRGTKETVFPFNDYAHLPTYYQHRPENQWLIGKPSGYWINGNSLLYLKIKKPELPRTYSVSLIGYLMSYFIYKGLSPFGQHNIDLFKLNWSNGPICFLNSCDSTTVFVYSPRFPL